MSILLFNPLTDMIQTRDNFRYSNAYYYAPKTDVYESKNEIVIKMDLPGITRDQISIEASSAELEMKTEIKKVDNDVEKEQVEEKKEETIWTSRHIERANRNYLRKFKFNKPVDSTQAKVLLENGVLTITLPLRPEAQKVSLQIE